MTEGRNGAALEVAAQIAEQIRDGMILGLGSGSTVTSVLQELVPILRRRGVSIRGVPTSMQIQMVAEGLGVGLTIFRDSLDLDLDGADQVDDQLNLIKGGGGALLKEKILMDGAKSRIIVADEGKFAPRLGDPVRVPVEVNPLAREVVKKRLLELGGEPSERMLQKGYPYFTEGGNMILDTRFPPIEDARSLEVSVKSIAGVMECGIFTMKPISVYRFRGDQGFDLLSRLR